MKLPILLFATTATALFCDGGTSRDKSIYCPNKKLNTYCCTAGGSPDKKLNINRGQTQQPKYVLNNQDAVFVCGNDSHGHGYVFCAP
ncbi:hypothetical protein M3J09_007994 [Ascochyta lentis]